nr:hypothetical protein [Methylotenera mobilis]
MTDLIVIHAIECLPTEKDRWQRRQRAQPQRGMGKNGAMRGTGFTPRYDCRHVKDCRNANQRNGKMHH